MKEKLNLNSIIWALIFSMVFMSSVFILSQYSLDLSIAILIIAINSIFFGIYAIKTIRSLSTLDEVQVRIHFEAVSIAFVLTLLGTMVLGMIEIVKGLEIEKINFLYIFPLLFLFYIIGLIYSKRKYR